MSELVGLTLQGERVDVAVVHRGLGRSRVTHTFALDLHDSAPGALRAALQERKVRARRAHVGLPRRSAIVKAIELPPVAGADVRRMVGFELERHLPFPVGDALFDFEVLESTPGRPVRVLLVAAERRVYEEARQLVREAGLTIRVLDVAVHALARLPGRRRTGDPGRVVVWRQGAEVEVAILARGRLVASRTFPLPRETELQGVVLAGELERTLATLPAADRDSLREVVFWGEMPPPLEWNGPPVRPTGRVPDGIGGSDDRSLSAFAMALAPSGRLAPRLNLVPADVRPRPFPWPVAATAALASVALLVGAAIPTVTMLRDRRTLAELDGRLAEILPEVKAVEQLAADDDRARRELQTLRGFETQNVRPLPILRELTEALPADVWLTSFSADRNGVELAGFANAASQLIPLLEGSSRLERAEFMAPVTKGRDKEQFRLRAAWERPAVGK